MKLTKKEIKVIYLALRILDKLLPYEDEVEEVLDLCRSLLNSDEIGDLEEEAFRIISGSEVLKPLAESF